MPAMSLTPSALKAYLAGRKAAEFMSLDPQTVSVPPEFAGEDKAYRLGVAEEQQGAPLPEQTRPLAAPPTQPPRPLRLSPAAPKVLTAAQQRHQDYKKFLTNLSKQPVETIRTVAEAQIAEVDRAFKEAPFFSRTYQIDYAGIKDRLENARTNMAGGDRLKDNVDEPSKTERRNSYLRAYSTAFTEADNLASTIGDESFLVLTIGNVVIPAAIAVKEKAAEAGQAVAAVGKELAQTTKAAVGQVGDTVKVVAVVVGVGAAVALVAYAFQSGKRRR